ncbi:MAG TPA: beta-ketoacyl-ACP synthase III [Anaerolineae bacterium]|nr:beta-ketoacyl-ACP synthase III [Anaerolineae bacterium]
MRYAHIQGWGSYLPEHVYTNDEIAQTVETTDEWIYRRTGIKERRIANSDETTATLSMKAAEEALGRAGLPPSKVEMIVVATSTPDYIFPSTACQVQDHLGATKAAAFDISAACSGFVYALSIAAQSIQSGAMNNALVIGAETMSRVLNWDDRGTCILFGDGAGAVVLEASDTPGGVLASVLRSDGSGRDLLYLPAVYQNPMPMLQGGKWQNGHKNNQMVMNGRQVFRFATRVLAESLEEVTEKAGLTVNDLNLIVPHQANVRILETAAKKLKLDQDIFFSNVETVGNTSAASIPVALCEALKAGRLQADDHVALVGFGGGLTWGATVIKWAATPPEPTRWQALRTQASYGTARVRSRFRQWQRRVGARLGGSPTPDARMRDAVKGDKE